MSELEAFHGLVLRDPVLQERLRETRDWDAFRILVVELAAERGYTLSEAELTEARRDARRAWLERRL